MTKAMRSDGSVYFISNQRTATAALVAFFDQFEPAEGWRPRLSAQDQRDIARELGRPRAMDVARADDEHEPGSTAWWDALMRRMDGRAAAKDFRDRMRVLAERGLPVTTGWRP